MRNSPERDAFPIEADGFPISYMIRLLFTLIFQPNFNATLFLFMGLSGYVSIELPSRSRSQVVSVDDRVIAALRRVIKRMA